MDNHLNFYKISSFEMRIGDKTWKITGYQGYLEYIKNQDGNLEGSLSDLIYFVEKTNFEKPFKWNIEIGSIQFLAGVFSCEREILIASKQLGFELMLNYAHSWSEADLYLKNHVDKLAQIPTENSPAIIEYIAKVQSLELFDDNKFDDIHVETQNLAQVMAKEIGKYKQSFFEKISDFGLNLTANFMLVRIHLLKFLAILPNLDHDKNGVEVKKILLETFRRLIVDNEKAVRDNLRGQKRPLPEHYISFCRIGVKVFNIVPAHFLARVIRKSVSIMATRFIAGENIISAKSSLTELMHTGRDATIDQLGELVVSKKEADQYTEQVIEIIDGMAHTYPVGAKNAVGILRAHVSIKVTALCHDFKPHAFDYSYEQIAPRLIKILKQAKEKKVFVNVDAEHYHYRDCVFEIYKKALLDTTELQDFEDTGIVVQAYLRDADKHLDEVKKLAELRKLRMPIRLVKGAYWDAETIEASAHNFDPPEFINKEETDIMYRALICKTLENGDYLQLAVASHNIQDHAFSETTRKILYPSAPGIEHQCLHMTYEALSYAMAGLGWATRNYIPVGNLLVGMAYLVRRIMENSSQVGVLTIMRSHNKVSVIKLPYEELQSNKEKKQLNFDESISHLTRDFKNIFPIRSYLKKHLTPVKKQIEKQLEDLKKGKLYYDNGKTEVFASSEPSLLLGRINDDNKDSVDTKIEKVFNGFINSSWRNHHQAARFYHFCHLADLLLIHREELSALIMIEAGKTIDEATADVDEAIDFINFYMREQVDLESNQDTRAKGVVGVIAPWNFPIAILCGMTVAPLIAGNTVVVKPAEQTPLIALKFLELCRLAGIGEDILQMVTGEAEVGKAIVDNEHIVGVVFTGSKAVGESIYKKLTREMTSSKYPYLPLPKFAITEMGGKNAIIVTNNSELDEVVSGVIYSAFAHAGQKCSAASRIIIDEKLKDRFLERFSLAVRDIKVGKSYDMATTINPLISAEDKVRVQDAAKRSAEEVNRFGGRVIIDLSQEDYPGHCVGPAVFELNAKTVLNEKTMASEEVFGPLIHIIGYKNINEAIELFNSTQYGLTGGLFCQSQDNIDEIVPFMNCGNIYVNRPNTGARVAIEPFGGFKMSGTGPKAGGQDYLPMFNYYNLPEYKTRLVAEEGKTLDSLFIATDSGLSLARRLEILNQFIENTVQNFEVLFTGIDEVEKQHLTELQSLLANGQLNIDDIVRPNRSIPGQMSFSKLNLGVGNGLIIDGRENLEYQLFHDLIINLLVGNGVSVLCLNDKSFNHWNAITQLASSSGFSEFNFNCYRVGVNQTKDILHKETFHFVLTPHLDLNSEFKKAILENAYDNALIKIFYFRENLDLDRLIDRYTHTRSFAINTMRHGAPLTLDL